jgi:hypothetical protein
VPVTVGGSTLTGAVLGAANAAEAITSAASASGTSAPFSRDLVVLLIRCM